MLIPRLPFGSNLDEFHLLGTAVSIGWETTSVSFAELDPERDMIVLPGSKHVAADLGWMRRQGIADAVIDAIDRGVRCIGICGGAMMLGQSIQDPYGIEGAAASEVAGLGVLDHDTVMKPIKTTTMSEVEIFGQRYSGYEIRYGHLDPVIENGSVTATTVHGLFEHPEFIAQLFGVRVEPVLDRTFEQLADVIDQHLDTSWLMSLTQQSR